ncbi:60S acidic ribosomal protein P1 [Saguinus oedipus]|uniref:60S acidic ribosomal protein P1 n=1 Tax=Saguinus oedipus TaxID=9490 RepID=A0ABQ9VS97_SAGOE|nr:60S acidic ribosomal protein P1 [Saguinus oedipus]
MAPNSEHAGIYLALTLHEDEVTIWEDKINALIKAAGVNVEPFRPGLFAKALGSVNIGSLICNVGAGEPPPAAVLHQQEVLPPPLLLLQLRRKWKQRNKNLRGSDDDMSFGHFD